MKYFWNDVALKADVNRHREEQLELESKIKELEALPQDSMTIAAVRVYRNFLCLLLQSKADVVSKIGKT